jgi:hypothetical protein
VQELGDQSESRRFIILTGPAMFLYKCVHIYGVRGGGGAAPSTLQSPLSPPIIPSCFTEIHLFKDDSHHGLQVAPRFPLLQCRKAESS